MTDTGQEEVDPESKQYKIDNQDWKKSKVYSPQRDEDKPPPRGRGSGWRARAKESPTPGNKQADKDTSRGQRSSGYTRRDDTLEDDRRNEEARRRMEQQEERRREDERRWEEDRGWKGSAKKEAPRQPAGDGMAESRTSEKSRKPRRAAQEVYVPRAKRREAQQLYVPRARRGAESGKSASAEKDPPRTANPREPPEKKRIVANQTQQRGGRTREEIKSQKSSGRTEELRHKSDKYLEFESKEERRSSSGHKPDRTGDSSRSSEGRRNRGRDSDRAAKRQSASKHSKQVPSYASSKSRSEGAEITLDDSNTGGELVDTENSVLVNPKHGADVNEISIEDKHESEDRVSTEPQGNLDDQIDTEIKEDKHVQKDDNSGDHISGSAVEHICSVSESSAQGNSATSELEPSVMPNVVGSEVSSNKTDSQMKATVDEYNRGVSDMPDQSCEIEQTMSSNVNNDAVPSSPQTNMELPEEIVQDQQSVPVHDQRSCDEGDKDISAVDLVKSDVKEEGIMEVEDNRVMKRDAESEKMKVDGDKSKSPSQQDTTPELGTMDEVVKADGYIEQEHQVFIDSNDKLPEELNIDVACSGESGTNITPDIENDKKRTSREQDNVSSVPVSAGVVLERTGDSGSVEKELDGKETPTVPDMADTVTNDIDVQVADKESVDVKDTNVSVSTAINDANNDNVIAVDQEQDQCKSKQMEVFKDALLTHTGSEDYGSSSSDAAYADVEKSSTSSQEDAMDTEEDAGADGGDGDGGVVDEDSWDALFDDTGDSLKPEEEEELAKGIGKVKVSLKKPKHDYYNWQPKDNMDYSAYEHVIEVYDFPAEFKTPDLIMSFSDFKNKGFDIKWVDDTHALAIFATPLVAQDALGLMNPIFRTRPLALATRESKMKAKRSIEFLKPFKPKPDTTAVAARRLISGALGIKTKVTREQREAERRKLREAKDKKRADRQQTNDIWEGNV